MKTIKSETTARKIEAKNFGIFDANGREIGVVINTHEFDLIPRGDDKYSCTYDEQPGHYYYAQVNGARNGERFGAGAIGQFFATIEERDAHIAKRVAASLKAATKKASK